MEEGEDSIEFDPNTSVKVDSKDEPTMDKLMKEYSTDESKDFLEFASDAKPPKEDYEEPAVSNYILKEESKDSLEFDSGEDDSSDPYEGREDDSSDPQEWGDDDSNEPQEGGDVPTEENKHSLCFASDASVKEDHPEYPEDPRMMRLPELPPKKTLPRRPARRPPKRRKLPRGRRRGKGHVT